MFTITCEYKETKLRVDRSVACEIRIQTMWTLTAVLMSSLCGVWLQLLTTMRWVDHINKDDLDIFFDRAVIILIADPDPNHYLKTHKDLALGVLIDNVTVLTSFNPFRKYIKTEEKRWTLTAVLMSSLCGVWLQLLTTMRWVDHINKDDMDIFFDRAVIILIADPDPNHYLKTHKDLALGVLIDNVTVLTSFNPFRKYIKIKEKRYDVTISVLYERQISNWENITYTLRNFSVNCARQVIPMPDEEVDWAMDDKKENSPMHDLMVIRLDQALTLIPQDPNLYSFDQYGQSGVVKRTAGPMETPLANLSHTLGRDIKFASLGFINRKHIFKSCVMRSHTFDPEDNVVTDCDGWIPRQWGLFICIRNIENFKGLGSGALLIHNNRLFGIGSFMLKRGDSSILVFTDVREYHHLIRNTCTMYDQKLGQDIDIIFPNHTTKPTTTIPPNTT